MQFCSPAIPRTDWSTAQKGGVYDVEQLLSTEILNKLEAAWQSSLKDDAESLCCPIFFGLLAEVEPKHYQLLQRRRPCCFYQILADYYLQSWDEAEKMLEACRRMWSQPYVAGIFAMVLYRWLLLNDEAGGRPERRKHFNVLLTGCRQLFRRDFQLGTFSFQPIFHLIHQLYHRQTTLPIKNSFLPLIGQFIPHYCHKSMLVSVMGLPFEREAGTVEMPWKSSKDAGFTPDTLFLSITELLKQTNADQSGLVHYLRSLADLKHCPMLNELRPVTKLQFQSQIYALTSQGGPRYPPAEVRKAAFATLDSLYPAGARTRKLISQLFMIFHPLDWPRNTANIILITWRQFLALLLFISSCLILMLRWTSRKFR